MAAKDTPDFNLIIEEIDADRLDQAAAAFAKNFSLDEALASQILKSAPIIFATKLTKAEVKAITPKLTELSKLGLEFRVTARVAGKVPKVNWPIRPQFTVGGSGGGPNGLAFEWENTAFVCPSCGETFLFRRLGKLKLAEVAPAAVSPAPAGRPGQAAKGRGAPPPEEEEEERLELAEDSAADVAPPEPAPAGEDVQLEGEPLPGEGESLELPDAVEEIKLDDAPLEAAPEPAAEEESPAPQLSQVADDALAEAEPEIPSGELYNVFLSKITDRSRQDKVAELISKVKGCSMSEAKDLTTRLVIPIAKNISKEHAEDILNQFKKIKVFGRMTKVK